MDEKMEEGIKHKLTITFDGVREKNIEQLRILNQAIFPINYQEQVYKDILACGDITQLAYHNDVLVGAVACRLEKSPEGPKLYIITLGVLAPYRGFGVGSRLLSRCLNHAKHSLPEIHEAYLHVQTSNTEGIEFYKKFGFEVGEILTAYYGRRIDPPDAVVLRRHLNVENQNGESK